jgi:peptide/nickel transport system permease protein
VEGITFEPEADINGELVILGRVYGLMGSDFDRRDLTIPLMWGIPLALAFGMVGAVTTSLLSMIFAALSAWFGGWVDSLVQRLTEINLILPALAIAMTIYLLYSKSIWVILLVFVLLSIFGVGVKNYRSIFMQSKEAT